MIFSKGILFVIVLTINSNSAINLNIFRFNKAPVKNETKLDTTLIQPTATLTSSIKITKAPNSIVSNSHIPDLIVQVDNEKYELENETETADASPEVPSVSIPNVPSTGQEIDETRNSSRYSVMEPLDEGNNSKYFLENVKMPSYFSSFPKVTLPKLPSFPKKKTVTFTKTLVSKITRYEKVYPSCVRLENVKSVCEGTFITIQPTPTQWNQKTQEASLVKLNDANDTYDIIEPPEDKRRRDSDAFFKSKIGVLKKLNSSVDLLEPSELDYEFELIDSQHATPTLEKLLNATTKPSALLESLLINEPKFEFVTERLSVTTVQKITDNGVTATVVARNCVPKDMNLKICSKPIELPRPVPSRPITLPPSIPFLPIPYSGKKNATKLPIIKEQKKEKNEQKNFFATREPEKIVPTLPSPPQIENKPYNVLEQLNQYLIINANRLIHGSGGFETVDLNAESTIIERPEYPHLYSMKSMKKKK